MPLIRTNTAGAEIYASAKVARRFTFAVAAGGIGGPPQASLSIQNLPYSFFWVLAFGGPPGMTFTPQFSVSNTVGGIGVVPRWHDLTAPMALVAGTPLTFGVRVAANAIGVNITVPGGGGGSNFNVILTASL